MSIKKLLLSALLLTTTGFAYAQNDPDPAENYIQIEDRIDEKAIVAGVGDLEIVQPKQDDEEAYEKWETVDKPKITEECIKINLNNTNNGWAALQFDLWLPKGVEVGTFTYWDEVWVDADEDEEDPEILENGGQWVGQWVSGPHIWNTNRLTWINQGTTTPFTISAAQQDDAEDEEGNKYSVWRVVSYNGGNKAIKPNSSDPAIMLIRLIATDQATTGTFYAYVKDAILAKSSSNGNVSGLNCPIKESRFKIQINAKIGAGGYGTFSWPRDVDFTGVEAVEEVYVAKGAAVNGWLHLDPIEGKKVPAGTGVFIKGTAGATVNPETLDEGAPSVSSTLGATATAPYVAGDNVFALATKNGKTALYPVAEGVEIPKYKAYMTVTGESGAKYISFGDTPTNIDALDVAEEDGDIYTLGGQKVQKTTMKGVYIKNGQKVVVK